MSKFRNVLKIVRVSTLCLSIVLLAISTIAGMLHNYLLIFLLLSTGIMLVTFIASVATKQAGWQMSGVESVRSYVIGGLFRNVSWIVVAICIHVAIVPIQFSPREFTTTIIIIWCCVFILCLIDWFPRIRTSKTLNIVLGIFLIFLTAQLVMTYIQPRTGSNIELGPFLKGDWYVLHGGNSVLMNHHHFAGSQKYALDLIAPEDGKLPLEQVTDLKQYNSFGSVIYSPVEGVVVKVENSLEDLKIGENDRDNIAGNHVVIKTDSDIFILMAHLQKDSVLVAEGERVRIGQELARIGNSGNTTQPHLHLQAMTKKDFSSPDSMPIPLSFKVGDRNSIFYRRNDVVPGLQH